MSKKKGKEEFDLSEAIGGKINILGLNLDIGKLLASPEDATSQLEGLRQRLKEMGLKETLTDEQWKAGGATVSGHVRVRGMGGEEEYHIGTTAGRRPRAAKEQAPEPAEVVEPPMDVFDEADGLVIVADVPGVGLEHLEVRVDGQELLISTKPAARRAYKKTVHLGANVDSESMEVNCRNGVLEIRFKKGKPGGH